MTAPTGHIEAARYIGAVSKYKGSVSAGDIGFDDDCNIAVFNGNAWIVFHNPSMWSDKQHDTINIGAIDDTTRLSISRRAMYDNRDLLTVCGVLENAITKHSDPNAAKRRWPTFPIPQPTAENVLCSIETATDNFWSAPAVDDPDEPDDAIDDATNTPMSVPFYPSWGEGAHRFVCYANVVNTALYQDGRLAISVNTIEHPAGLRVGETLVSRGDTIGITARVEVRCSYAGAGDASLKWDHGIPKQGDIFLGVIPYTPETFMKGDRLWQRERHDVVCVDKVFPGIIEYPLTGRAGSDNNPALSAYYNV